MLHLLNNLFEIVITLKPCKVITVRWFISHFLFEFTMLVKDVIYIILIIQNGRLILKANLSFWVMMEAHMMHQAVTQVIVLHQDELKPW